ncbi:amino acid permease [Leishmania braziliensis MHOM/BR/75/M2904]|uniref:Amino acid permease n=1 Tax=Leishmania braziliensis TaxID=5660 RepID=A4HJG3_LEIBR|nr:amino acid permease [Leishmania braziliensis MHOM/BR/75/M2904]CAM42624.1 amino acid permease [Leishmania braziliensis MHOM/BR/75/M2904]
MSSQPSVKPPHHHRTRQREEFPDRISSHRGVALDSPRKSVTMVGVTSTTSLPAEARRAGQRFQRPSHSQPRRTGCLGVLQCIRDGVIKAVCTIIPPGGILSAAFNMASASIGAGILGLPSATDSAGLILATLYLIVITYFSVFSMYILALAAQNTRIKSFEGMARWLFPAGKYAFSYWAAFIRWFYGFSGCVTYVISAGNSITPMFAGAAKQHPDNSAIQFFATTQGNRVFTVIIWLFVMLPLLIPKHVDSLRYASALAVMFIVYFVIMAVVHSIRHGLPETSKHVRLSGNQVDDDKLEHNTVFLFRTGNSVIHTVGIFMFAYVCQINACEVFWDFRPEIRTAKNYTLAAFIGMMMCGTLYLLVAVFGYLDFGSKNLLGKSLLLMFNPFDEVDIMIAYVGIMVKLCVAYALLGIAARNSLYYLIGFQHRYRNRPAAAVAGAAEELGAVDGCAAATAQCSANPVVAMADIAVVQSDGLVGADNNHGPAEATKDRNPSTSLNEDSVDEEYVDNTTEDTTYVDNIPFWQHLLVVLALSVASLLCGLFIPNINTVFGFAGAISGGFIAFVFPALFVMYSGSFTVAQVGWFTYLNTYLLLICGVVGIVFGTAGTIYETI